MSDDYKIEVKRLRNEVQSLRDELAMMKRKYEDILYNLDTDNFSSRFVKEQGDMKTAIKITAKGVESKVSKEDLENDIKNSSTITQMANSIKSKVSETDLSTKLENYSTIEQTAERIQLMVSKNLDLDSAEVIEDIQEAENEEKIYVIQEKDDYGNIISETYYYYDDILKGWTAFSGDTIYTVFNQTESGFELKGNVSINGNLITEGKISANLIDTESLSCTRLYAKGNSSGYYAKIYSGMGDFGVYSPSAEIDAYPKDSNCVWGIYNTDPDFKVVNFYSYGDNYMGYNHSQKKLYPKGTWDFSSCDEVRGLDTWVTGSGGSGTVVAVFG